MKKGFKLTAVMAGLLLMTAGSSGVFATCQTGVFPIYQCGFVGWFAPPPADAGTVSAIWWQLGYGNNIINDGTVGTAANDGTGMVGTSFKGNDSGASPMTLTNADSVLSQYASIIPDGSLCANFENTWGGTGIDGCPDNLRTTSSYDNDDSLNPYWTLGTGPCPIIGDPSQCTAYYNNYYLVDYPLAVLARESTNKYFALAFVASNDRNADPGDASEGVFNLGGIVNGDPNPVDVTPQLPAPPPDNVIPWQLVPRPHVDSISPITPGVPRNVSISWDNIRLVHDNSTKVTGARAAAPVVAGGVGVLDHLDETGGLCRFQVQTAPTTDPNTPASALVWVNAGAAIPCGSGAPTVTANLTVNPDTAIRVRTIIGKLARTASTAAAQTRLGAAGDLGFEATDCNTNNCVNSPPVLVVGGGLVSQQITDAGATKENGGVRVVFRTTAELSVTGIDVLGRGDVVIKSVACKQCTTGVGDSYDVLLDRNVLKGAKTLRLRLNGPGSLTDAIPIQ